MGQTITDTILSAIDYAIDRKLQNLSYDQTFMSVVQGVNDDGTYTILDRSGCERDVKCLTAIEDLAVGDNVAVTIPSGTLRNAFISGVGGVISTAYDQTYMMTVTAVNDDGSYTVEDSDGNSYTVECLTAIENLEVGDTVAVTFPSGDSNSAYISATSETIVYPTVSTAYDQTYSATISESNWRTWPYTYTVTDSNGMSYSSILTWDPDIWISSGASVYLTLPCGDSDSAFISGLISGSYGYTSTGTSYSC